jgi:hypothetical protein
MDGDDEQEDDDHHTGELTTTAYQLFNANPFQRIFKATDNFFRWAGNRKKEKKSHQHRQCDHVVTQSDITSCQEFLQELHDIGRCFDYREKAFKKCQCAKKLSEDDIREGSVFLVVLANQEKALRDTQLKGMMAAANQNRLTKEQLRKKFWRTNTPAAIDGAQPNFQLPFGTQPNVCRQFFQFLFCLKPDTKWKSLRDSLKKDGIGPRKHGLAGNNNRKINSPMGQCETDLHAFFEVLVTDHGEPRATRLVRTKTKTGLRDAEIALVELPSAMTKRGIYQKFCYDRGYAIKANAIGSYPKLKDYPARDDFDDVFWPPGSEPLPVCSWCSFATYWKVEFPKLVVRPPSEDVSVESAQSTAIAGNMGHGPRKMARILTMMTKTTIVLLKRQSKKTRLERRSKKTLKTSKMMRKTTTIPRLPLPP